MCCLFAVCLLFVCCLFVVCLLRPEAGRPRAEPKAERVVTTTSITINRLISRDGMGWDGKERAEPKAERVVTTTTTTTTLILYILLYFKFTF